MKYLFAAATVAALMAAMPASAQTAYGMTPGENAAAGTGGHWRDSVVIYAETPDSILLDKLTAPIDAGTLATGTTPAVTFDVRGGSVGVAGAGITTNATTPVPEPATWAMMLIGFGAVGVMLRRRHATLRYA